MSRILIITPKQPSGNPRMRKAADALATSGKYGACFVCL